jgi:hypothetical protein
VEERFAVGSTVIYRFGHAFFRQVLYEEMLAPRRIRLQRSIARVLEKVYARRLDEHASELAEHYAFSSDVADPGGPVRATCGKMSDQRLRLRGSDCPLHPGPGRSR